ncbi:MAG: MarR family transcriptional regulator [Streptosporangiaceae bacterium]
MQGEPPTAGDGQRWQIPWPEETSWEAPWAAPAGTPGWSDERRLLAIAFALAVRQTGSLMNLMGQAAADRVGINATDLNCLNILSFSGSLTAGDLAKATGLTTASITGVVDRLEAAGFVRRERDLADRRRVVVTIVIERALREVASIFAPMVADWQQLAERYSDDELRLIVEFYDQMQQIIRKHLARLRDRSAPAADPPA